ncbi:MAG: hypothetical protein ABFE13_16495 [Phycisphaerales bacterium]
MGTFWQDNRYAFRMLRKRPGIAAISVTTLALGMAGNTVIFSFFNAFFLRPLPFHEPDRLVDLDETSPRWNLEYTGLSYPDFHSWRRQNRSFNGVAAWTAHGCTSSFEGNAERIQGAWVTHDLLSVLGLHPALGRASTSPTCRSLRLSLYSSLPWCRWLAASRPAGRRGSIRWWRCDVNE